MAKSRNNSASEDSHDEPKLRKRRKWQLLYRVSSEEAWQTLGEIDSENAAKQSAVILREFAQLVELEQDSIKLSARPLGTTTEEL